VTEYRLAPAKINLALHVTGRRADGYHLLESLVVFTRFGDRLAVRPAQADTFSVDGAYGQGIPDDDGNLVLRARNLLRQAAGTATRPVAIRLEKNLPASSGVGGGSSDAAATLRALCRLWSIDPREETARGVAAALGADVPMCLSALPLVARGIGHDIVPLADFPALPIVLVNPGVSVSTPSVFSRLASRENPPLPPLPRFADADAVAVGWRRPATTSRRRRGRWHPKSPRHTPRLSAPAHGLRACRAPARPVSVSLPAPRARRRRPNASAANTPAGSSKRPTPWHRESSRMSRIDEQRPFVPVGIAVLTVSDTRTLADDRSGQTLVDRIAEAGHRLAARDIVRDDRNLIREQVLAWSEDSAIDVVITTGGTGFTGRDVTPEALEPIFEKRMDGFSEVFHRISYDKIGTSTIQSRATGGVVNATFVFVLPGSPGACKDAWDGILKPQLDYRHMPCNFVEIMPRLDEHLKRGATSVASVRASASSSFLVCISTEIMPSAYPKLRRRASRPGLPRITKVLALFQIDR
jgi:molybdenum cofactor biosynthesis protein B